MQGKTINSYVQYIGYDKHTDVVKMKAAIAVTLVIINGTSNVVCLSQDLMMVAYLIPKTLERQFSIGYCAEQLT